MPNSPDFRTPDEKSAAAIAGYLEAGIAANFNPVVPVRLGGLGKVSGPKPATCIVVTGDGWRDRVRNAGFYIASIIISVESNMDEPDADKQHPQRVGLVVAMMQNLPLLMSVVNPPDSGPDVRSVQDFRIVGLGIGPPSHAQAKRVLKHKLPYTVNCHSA